MKSKMGQAVTTAFKGVLRHARGCRPLRLQTDKGKEFCNVAFMHLLSCKSIRYSQSCSGGTVQPNIETVHVPILHSTRDQPLLVKAIMELEWILTVSVQLNDANLKDTCWPTFGLEGDDLILERKEQSITNQISFRIQTTFAHKIWWLMKNEHDQWRLGPNLNYTLRNECEVTFPDRSTKEVMDSDRS